MTKSLEAVRCVNLQHYRMCHYVGRAAAAHSPVIAPLPEKFLLTEIVNLFMKHAYRIGERLWELGVERAATRTYPAALRQRLAARAPDWTLALAELAHLAEELPAIYDTIADGLDDTEERRPDRELYRVLAQEIRSVLAQPAVAQTLSRLPPATDRLYDLVGARQMADDETVPAAPVTDRIYPAGVRTTREPVDAPFKPIDEKELAFFVHNQLQIEFVAIDIVMRNISDFGGLPLTFYVDQARHAHDEMRHIQMLLRELASLGADITDYPFEVPDRFAMMIGMPLEHRLAILSRTGESEAIEAAQVVIPHLLDHGMEPVAVMLENVLFDEVRHTWYGNKWLTWLTQDAAGVDKETELALQSYNTALSVHGSRMPLRDTDYLTSMARRSGGIDPVLRAHAGFTDKELAVMRGLRHWPVNSVDS